MFLDLGGPMSMPQRIVASDNSEANANTNLHFSIIIPAHNEERYIGETLEHVRALRYPPDRYQVIVVENGSSDRTLQVARRFEGGNILVISRPARGVSAAKNAGIEVLSDETDWVVFLDADTLLKPDFLGDLESLLQSARKRFAVGTTRVLPVAGGRRARAWFRYWDFMHRFGGSYSIQIVKGSLFPGLEFDERLTMGEDLRLIRQARKFGKFFYLPTRTVYTSTRRFDTVGYWKLFFHWSFVGMLRPAQQKRFGYAAVR